MTWFLSWLIVVELFGLAALPLAVRLFRLLPDHGYLFSKPLGILLVCYLCWLPAVFGLLRFQQATIMVVLLLVAAFCWWAWGAATLRELSSSRGIVLFSEGLFLASLTLAVLIRAYNPEISGTEKPMDFAFLNALYRGDRLPPEDPWMSGHSISYYYFGYLLMAAIAKVASVPAAAAYNLAVALIFALLLTGSYSLAFNLISSIGSHWRAAWRAVAALTAPLIVGIMGNLEIGLEVLAARGIGGPDFWQWAGVKGLAPVAQPDGWFPTSHWWWWRASRIIPTTKPDGINEFPFFSFLLGDLHPHFMALPWGLLMIAIALAVLKARSTGKHSAGWERLVGLTSILVLGFLLVGNSWDYPTYAALFGVAALVPLFPGDWSPAKLIPQLKRLAAVALGSVLIYSPFLLGFSSQTRGIGISADRTPLASMLIIFGAFFAILVGFLAWRAWPATGGEDATAVRWTTGLWVAAAVLIVASWALGSLALIVGMLLLVWGAWRRLPKLGEAADPERSGAERFLLLLSVGGLLLVLGPEFLFLNDLFGTRMNTVFKFHYQAWVLLGIASAVALVWLSRDLRPWLLRSILVAGAALMVGVGLLYPVGATPAKAHGFRVQPTLDGGAFYRTARPEDYAAIEWLSGSAAGRPVVLEATGGDYSEYARVSTFSGLPTVIGWAGHEVQWRGRGEEPQRRTEDLEAIYRTADRSSILGLLEKYRVQYVFVGSLELEKYGPGVSDRFEGLLTPVHRQGRVTIYQLPGKSQ